MSILFDDDISGAGQEVFGDNVVLWALCHITTVGPGIRSLELGAPDHILRAGWFTFFHRGSDIGGVERDYYDPPKWLDFVDTRWIPQPPRVGADLSLFFSWGVRWVLSPGTEAHLLVVN